MNDEGALRLLICCSGVGVARRGFESFFREAFDALRGEPGLSCLLLKGAGEASQREAVLPKLRRDGRMAALVGRITGRTPYAVEQWSTFPTVALHIRRFRPHVIFYSEPNLGFLLYRLRRLVGVPFRLLYSNAAPCHPPFVRTDFVQQVAPLYQGEALAAGEPPEKHMMVPLGVRVPPPPVSTPEAKRAARARLGLPLDRKVVLSVGWISREHKRMDYVVEEVAKLPKPRPFLQLLGAMDQQSVEILEMGVRLLGRGNFAATSVAHDRVSDYYSAADCFALGSLREGFGRVYVEALMHGLPVIAHRHPVMEYVVGPEGILGDLSRPDGMASLLHQALADAGTPLAARRRWQSARDRFDWSVLVPDYRAMFRAAATRPLPPRVGP